MICQNIQRGMSKEEISRAFQVLQTLLDFGQENGSKEEPSYMIAFSPGDTMKIILEKDAKGYLPCFGEEDTIELAPDLKLVMSYDRQMLFINNGQKSLTGTALFYAVDELGEIISLNASDIYEVQQMLNRRTHYIFKEGVRIPILYLNG